MESPSASVGLEEVGGASEEGEEASMVGRLIGLLGVTSSSLGDDLLRTLKGRVRERLYLSLVTRTGDQIKY